MNLANKITIVRIMLVPIFMVLLLSDFPYSNVIAALIFIVAASTDTVDGYIARKGMKSPTLASLSTHWPTRFW